MGFALRLLIQSVASVIVLVVAQVIGNKITEKKEKGGDKA